jgi:hypothetical protein
VPKEPNPGGPRALPSQSPENDPSPDEAASSPASGTASRSESFIGDAGPAFDPDATPPPPPPIAEAKPPPLIEWEEETLEALLRLKGRGLHAAIGVAEEDWHYTEIDLAAIAPPLTRICNRYEPIQRLAKYSDPLTLTFALGAYGVRSLEERREVLGDLEEDEGGTTRIEPLEYDSHSSDAPTPQTAPRQAASFPTAAGGPPPPMQPSEGVAPAQPPRAGEADIDPTEVQWEVPGG